MTANDLIREMLTMSSPKKAKASAWFFKSGPGEYGEGDKFLGLTVPKQRKIAKKYKDLPLREIEKLLKSPWHEHRLTALFILVLQYNHGDKNMQKIYNFYLANTKYINNWDLVDASASYIVGQWLFGKPERMKALGKLADSSYLWERRIAMVSTLNFIVHGQPSEALAIARKLVYDQHDLIQKAVGWMLREVGKRCGREYLTGFLDKYAATMPRTSLRYSIEHFDPKLKAHYMGLVKSVE